MAESWNASAPYGPSFFLLILLVDAPISLLHWLVGLAPVPTVLAMLVNAVLLCIGTAATASALSMNYLAVFERPDGSQVDEVS